MLGFKQQILRFWYGGRLPIFPVLFLYFIHENQKTQPSRFLYLTRFTCFVYHLWIVRNFDEQTWVAGFLAFFSADMVRCDVVALIQLTRVLSVRTVSCQIWILWKPQLALIRNKQTTKKCKCCQLRCARQKHRVFFFFELQPFLWKTVGHNFPAIALDAGKAWNYTVICRVCCCKWFFVGIVKWSYSSVTFRIYWRCKECCLHLTFLYFIFSDYYFLFGRFENIVWIPSYIDSEHILFQAILGHLRKRPGESSQTIQFCV